MATVIIEESTKFLTVVDESRQPSVIVGPITSTGSFLDLTDTPSSIVGYGGDVVAVKPSEDGFEFITIPGFSSTIPVGYTELTWVSGLPSLVEKYEDDTKANKLFTVELTFADGLPTTIVTTNHTTLEVETATFVFTDGLLQSVTKT